MRWLKYYSRNEEMIDPRFRCFGCCHVRTGTISLGIYNMVLQAGTIVLFLFAATNPDVMANMWGARNEKSNDGGDIAKVTTPLSTKMDSISSEGSYHRPLLGLRSVFATMGSAKPMLDYPSSDAPNQAGDSLRGMADFTNHRPDSSGYELSLSLLLGLFFITALMVWGAIKGRPLYILPFFCFQVFDFVLACLTAAGNYAWLPNVQEIVQDHPDMPFRDHLLKLDGQLMALFVLVAYVFMLIAKAYFIGILWACYQYLRQCQENTFTCTNSDDECYYESETLLPPNYDEALKMPAAYLPYYVPPPAYEAA